jgi:hypothetical protein
VSFASCVLVLWACGTALALDDSPDERFLSGLRQRSLFQLAEAYCADRLSDSSLAEKQRAELVIELSLTLAEHAVNSAPDQRHELWQRAWQITDEFSGQWPQSPWLIQVRLQGALGHLARGELARQESEVVSARDDLIQETRTYIRSAIRLLEGILDEVKLAQRQFSVPGGSGARRDGLTERELTSLERNVEYQLARAYRNQGQSYPSSTPDRANSMARAISLLESLATLPVSHSLGWKSRVDEIVCFRLLEDAAAAQARIQALRESRPPPAVELRARAESLLLALAAQRWEDVGSIMDQGRELNGATCAELDYAWLKAYLEGWRAAGKRGNDERANELRTKANETVQRISELYGAYWIRRAQMLMSVSIRKSNGSPDLEMLTQAAEHAFRSGLYDDALAQYDRARALAEEQGFSDRAFELAYTAATIEHQRNRHGEAMSRYRAVALAVPQNAEAAQAHRLAVFHAAQRARESSDSVGGYAALMQEHLRLWPQAATADHVRWQLGQLREFQADWQNAIAAYRSISADYPEVAKVVIAAGRSYVRWLSELKSAGQPTEDVASSAAEWFESLAVGPNGKPPERFSPLARDAAIIAARLRLNYTAEGHRRAEQLVSTALKGSPDASAQWKATAGALLVSSLAGQGKYSEATDVLRQISAGPPGELLEMLESLARVGADADQRVRASLAQLQLTTIELVRPRRDQLAAAEQQTLDRIHARALSDAGRAEDALRAFGYLAETYPLDGEIQEAHAELLSGRSDRPSLNVALARWRDVAGKSPTASDRWFRAKYSVAELRYRLGEAQKAAAIIEQLKVLHPEMGGPQMKRQFLELLEKCGR